MDSETEEKQAEARRCSEVMRDVVMSFRAQFEEGLRGSGITLAQLRMLKVVEEHRDVSAATIARLCLITPQTLQSMLTRATREGWIERGSSDRNQRFVTAELTAAGRALLQQGIALREQIEGRMWAGTSLAAMRSMRETLQSGLTKLRDAESSEPADAAHPSR